MSDLISRSALLEKIQFRIPNDRVLTDIVASCVKITKRIIEEAPTVDAVPVVHGRWNMIMRGNYECSVCGCIPYYAGSIDTLNFCPNCGAKMDGENDG